MSATGTTAPPRTASSVGASRNAPGTVAPGRCCVGGPGGNAIALTPAQWDDRAQLFQAFRARLQRLYEKYAAREGLFPVRFTGSLNDLRKISIRVQTTRATRSSRDSSDRGALADAGQRPEINRALRPRGNEQNQHHGRRVGQRADATTTVRSDSTAATVAIKGGQATTAEASPSTTAPSARRHEALGPSLDTFDTDALNEWLKMFQEHWLALVESVKYDSSATRGGAGSPTDERAADPAASSLFLSPGNRRYHPLAIDLLLSLFERDELDGCDNDDHHPAVSAPPGATTTTNYHQQTMRVLRDVRSRASFDNDYLSRRIIETADMYFPLIRTTATTRSPR